jgi:NADH-quinone oxidoreductase subunit J
MQEIIFYIFSTIATIGALMVVFAKNPVRSVLSLILTFIASAATWIILVSEFLAMLLVLVYVGAVMVLFLFVVMMLDIQIAQQHTKLIKWVPIALLMPTSLIILLTKATSPQDFDLLKSPLPQGILEKLDYNNVHAIGEELFTKYLLQFEISGIILLAGLVAAIALVFHGPRMRKLNNVDSQLKVKASDRLIIVKGDLR